MIKVNFESEMSNNQSMRIPCITPFQELNQLMTFTFGLGLER